MSKRNKRRFLLRAAGAAPGQMVVEPDAARSRLHFMGYGPEALTERDLASASELPALLGKHPVSWVNVNGLGDEAMLRSLADLFHVHPLALQDVASPHQRPKLDSYPEHDFVVLRMLSLSKEGELLSEQVGLFVGRNYVLTFQEREGGDAFGPVRERLRASAGRLRSLGADHLAYSLLDAVVSDYYPVLETLGEQLEALEEATLENPRPAALASVQAIKRNLIRVRRALWPVREALSTLGREGSPFMGGETRVYLRDLHDQTMQVMDLVETYRDLGSGLADLYLSSVSNRTNEVMKVLTIVSTTFIPLSFIAGVEGMNFDRASPFNLPELGLHYGYPLCLAVMASVAIGMISFFHRRGWIGQR